jgi:hypothetical protein
MRLPSWTASSFQLRVNWGPNNPGVVGGRPAAGMSPPPLLCVQLNSCRMCPHGILYGLKLRIVGDHLNIAFPIEVLNLDVGLARIFRLGTRTRELVDSGAARYTSLRIAEVRRTVVGLMLRGRGWRNDRTRGRDRLRNGLPPRPDAHA